MCHSAVELTVPIRHISLMSATPADPADPLSQQPNKKPAVPPAAPAPRPREIGGPKGPEPTRYGDWEVGGRCTDF
jgi:hypothetical protein